MEPTYSKLFDDVYKVVIIGESLVGKSSFLSSYIPEDNGRIHKSQYNDFEAKTVTLHSGKHIDVQVWDISGQNEFRDIVEVYYQGANAALILYDITNENSFLSAKDWIEEFKAKTNCNNIILVGNKVDLCETSPELRKVSKANALECAEKYKALFMEISAYRIEDVNATFEKLLDIIDHAEDKIRFINLNSNRILVAAAIVIAVILIVYGTA